MRQVQRWSYSGKPSHSTKDAVRFLVGDVDPDDKQLDDSEIDYLLTENGSPYVAAIEAANALAAYYSRDVDESTGKTTKSSSTRAQHYLDLAKRLAERRGARAVVPWAGGQSVSDKLLRENDADRVEPFFRRKLDDAPIGRIDPIRRTSEE